MIVTKQTVNSLLRKSRLDDCTKAELVTIIKALAIDFYPDDYFYSKRVFSEIKDVVRYRRKRLLW